MCLNSIGLHSILWSLSATIASTSLLQTQFIKYQYKFQSMDSFRILSYLGQNLNFMTQESFRIIFFKIIAIKFQQLKGLICSQKAFVFFDVPDKYQFKMQNSIALHHSSEFVCCPNEENLIGKLLQECNKFSAC